MAGPVADADRPVTEPAVGSNRAGQLLTGLWTRIALAVLVVALAVVAVLQALSVRSFNQRQDDRAAAVQAAKNEVVALLNVNAGAADANLKRLLDGATASFHDQLEQQAKAFRQALVQGKVNSSGAVAAAGLVSFGGGKAVVVLAAKATVRNSSSPKGGDRNYRLTVEVTKVNDSWLVSGITFVV